jgi:hypothetical protein
MFEMSSISLRLRNRLAGKRLAAALAPLLGRYHEARKSLRGSISDQSRQGLDWMNFFSGRRADRIRCLRRVLSR